MLRAKNLIYLFLIFLLTSLFSFSQIIEGNPENGKTLFGNNCTACHYSGPEEMRKIGPGL